MLVQVGLQLLHIHEISCYFCTDWHASTVEPELSCSTGLFCICRSFSICSSATEHKSNNQMCPALPALDFHFYFSMLIIITLLISSTTSACRFLVSRFLKTRIGLHSRRLLHTTPSFTWMKPVCWCSSGANREGSCKKHWARFKALTSRGQWYL